MWMQRYFKNQVVCDSNPKNGSKRKKLGHFIPGDKLHTLLCCFLPTLNKWPLWSSPINGSIAHMVMVGVGSIAWKRQSFPIVVFKAVVRARHSCLLYFWRDSICQSYPTHQPSVSCVSLLLQVRYHHVGEHQNGQSANSCDGHFTKVNKKGSLHLVPVIAEKSPWECLVYNQDVSQCLLKCSREHFHLIWAKFRWFC